MNTFLRPTRPMGCSANEQMDFYYENIIYPLSSILRQLLQSKTPIGVAIPPVIYEIANHPERLPNISMRELSNFLYLYGYAMDIKYYEPE